MCRVIIFLQPALLVLGGGGGGVVVVEVQGTEEKGKGVQVFTCPCHSQIPLTANPLLSFAGHREHELTLSVADLFHSKTVMNYQLNYQLLQIETNCKLDSRTEG
jgi:hypothetical protein